MLLLTGQFTEYNDRDGWLHSRKTRISVGISNKQVGVAFTEPQVSRGFFAGSNCYPDTGGTPAASLPPVQKNVTEVLERSIGEVKTLSGEEQRQLATILRGINGAPSG
jgi:hypothetical protein